MVRRDIMKKRYVAFHSPFYTLSREVSFIWLRVSSLFIIRMFGVPDVDALSTPGEGGIYQYLRYSFGLWIGESLI